MSDLFRTANINLLPWLVVFDRESNSSIILDRLRRPVAVLPKKWPLCDHSQAVAIEGPPIYGVEPIHQFHNGSANAIRCDNAVRLRVRRLVEGMPALKAELRRRALIAAAAADAAPIEESKAAEHADLISRTQPKQEMENAT